MARPRTQAARTPSGQLSRAGKAMPGKDASIDPTTVRRMIDASASHARMEQWGTTHGQLALSGKLTEKQFVACKRWSELATEYKRAVGVAEARSSMYALDAAGGTAPDPDSEAGAKIGALEKRVIRDYRMARDMLVQTVGSVETLDFAGLVEGTVNRDFVHGENVNIRKCAEKLVAYWRM